MSELNLPQAALSLVIHKQGQVSEFDVDDLIARYERKQNIIIDKSSFLAAVAEAVRHYEQSSARLFVCVEGACLKKAFLDVSPKSLEVLSDRLGCEVELSGCHWECEVAPVLTYKSENRTIRFGDCSSDQAVAEMCATIRNLNSR